MTLLHVMPACHMGLSNREMFSISGRPGALADHRIGKRQPGRFIGKRRNLSGLARRRSRRRRTARHHPTGEMGVGDGSVAGELGAGTSMSGVMGGNSLGASPGWPGWVGSGTSSGRGVSDMAILLLPHKPTRAAEVSMILPRSIAIRRSVLKVR